MDGTRQTDEKWWRKGSLRRLVFFLLLIGFWDLIFRLGLYEGFLMPSPQDVAVTFWRGLADGSLWVAAIVSLKRISVGYLISLITGLLLGFVIGRFKILEDTVGSVILGLQTIPSICWLPFAILWFGLSETAILFVVVMGAVLSIAIATDDGVKNTPPLLVRAGRTMGIKGLKLYLWVVLPAALPAIVSGMKLGWSFAWRSLMAGELLFVTAGVGQLLTVGRDLNDSSLVVAVMIVIVLIGLTFDKLIFAQIEKIIRRRWGLSGAS